MPTPKKLPLITGWILTAIPAVMLLLSAGMKVANPPMMADGFAHLGWPGTLTMTLAVLEIACTVLYLIPQTAVLGAILVTGYLGGAIATHVRLGEAVYAQAGLGVLAWLGLYLREPRLRALIPLRRGGAR